MKLRRYYSLNFGRGLPEDLVLPLVLEHENCRFEITTNEEQPNTPNAVLESRIDGSSLYLSEERQTMSGQQISPRIVTPSVSNQGTQAQTFVDIVSFIGDWQINFSSRANSDELVPENEEESVILDGFGTNKVYSVMTLTTEVRTFSMANFDATTLGFLIAREAGLRLYSQALDQQDRAGRFRELWRVLESAFGEQEQELVNKLTGYQPSIELGFSEEELRDLNVLRGRTSHAGSRAGIEEIRTVNGQAAQKVGRLKCLVEQVILTKQTWGMGTQAAERFTPLTSFIEGDGAFHVVNGQRYVAESPSSGN